MALRRERRDEVAVAPRGPQQRRLRIAARRRLAAAQLATGDDTRAGIAIGVATALKLFPGLAIVYLLMRGRWRATRAAIAAAGALTLLPIVRYGPAGFVELVREWLRTRTTGDWPAWDQNQSLTTSIGAAIPGDLGVVVGLGAFIVLVAAVVWMGWRRRDADRRTLGHELALVVAVSVVASPIAWVGYWLLYMPLFMIAAREAAADRPMARIVFVVAALLVSVVDGWRRSAPGTELLAAAFLLIIATAWWLRVEPTYAKP